MTIRTTSQLPAASAANDSQLIEVATPVGGTSGAHVSQKLTVGKLRDSFDSTIKASAVAALSATDSSGALINVRQLRADATSLMSGTRNIGGVKTFTSIPQIAATLAYQSSKPEQVVNQKRALELIQDNSMFVGPGYMVDADPGTDGSPSTTAYRPEFMYWHFDDFGTDSSQWSNPEANGRKTEADGAMCAHTGWLTVYGWLADNGTVRPAQAWVGLFANVQVRDPDDPSAMRARWVPIQMQPWIIGQKSSERQYVGFNVPVRAGLRLKIKTGFPVNGDTGGFAEQGNASLALNQPNTFVGYIIRAQSN